MLRPKKVGLSQTSNAKAGGSKVAWLSSFLLHNKKTHEILSSFSIIFANVLEIRHAGNTGPFAIYCYFSFAHKMLRKILNKYRFY